MGIYTLLNPVQTTLQLSIWCEKGLTILINYLNPRKKKESGSLEFASRWCRAHAFTISSSSPHLGKQDIFEFFSCSHAYVSKTGTGLVNSRAT